MFDDEVRGASSQTDSTGSKGFNP